MDSCDSLGYGTMIVSVWNSEASVMSNLNRWESLEELSVITVSKETDMDTRHLNKAFKYLRHIHTHTLVKDGFSSLMAYSRSQ